MLLRLLTPQVTEFLLLILQGDGAERHWSLVVGEILSHRSANIFYPRHILICHRHVMAYSKASPHEKRINSIDGHECITACKYFPCNNMKTKMGRKHTCWIKLSTLNKYVYVCVYILWIKITNVKILSFITITCEGKISYKKSAAKPVPQHCSKPYVCRKLDCMGRPGSVSPSPSGIIFPGLLR
jgi:hypothetical protein